MFFFHKTVKLDESQKQSFSGIMENKTLQSFVKTLEVLIALIE